MPGYPTHMWLALAFPLLLMALVLGVGKLDSAVAPAPVRRDDKPRA